MYPLTFLIFALSFIFVSASPLPALTSPSSPLERRTVCPVCFNDCAGVFDCPCVESFVFHTAGGECWNTAQPFYDFALTADCTGPETGIQVFSNPDCNGDSVWYNLDAGWAAPGFIGGLQSLWFLPVQPEDTKKVKRDAISLSVEGRDMREESPKVALGHRFVKTEANKVSPITQNDTALISRSSPLQARDEWCTFIFNNLVNGAWGGPAIVKVNSIDDAGGNCHPLNGLYATMSMENCHGSLTRVTVYNDFNCDSRSAWTTYIIQNNVWAEPPAEIGSIMLG